MKKKLLSILIFMFVVFMGFTSRVNAITCSYGTKSDNNAEWQRMFTFKVDDYNKISVDLANSPELSKVDEEESADDKKDHLYFEFIDTNGANDKYKIYLSMFSSKSMYDDVKNGCIEKQKRLNRISNSNSNDNNDYSAVCGCPSVLRYSYMSEGDSWVNFHWQIYNDELDKPDIEDSKFKFNDKDGKKDGYLIEEREKDKKLEDIEISDCPTYSYAMERIKNTMTSDGCENNKKFDEEYTAIEAKCESLRATSTYTDESGIPKACQKACTNLYDEVTYNIKNICGAEYKGGYCGSLGNKIVNWIFRIIRIIRYGLPAIVIILSILDYIKALSSEDEGEMKKVNKRFMVRVIAVALLFIVPFILDFILKIFNIPGLSSTNPFCAK